jgi:pathogenesis-related protein 1
VSKRPALSLIFLAATCAAQPPIATGMLAAHNAVRSRIADPPLTWSDKLAQRAQAWADVLLTRNQFAHSKSSYGENLFAITGASASPEQVVNNWASEARDYDHASNTCSKVCGHYTQIVWASTKEVGCAVARDSRREVWVCNYDPPGNYVGKRPY